MEKAYYTGIEAVKSLLEDRKKEINETLILAARDGEYEMVKFLLEAGADINTVDNAGNSVLIHGVPGGKEIVKLFLEHKADVNHKNNKGFTVLMFASVDTDTMELLLEAGAEINSKSKWGNTALSGAVKYSKYLECTKLLLEHGANPNDIDVGGNSVLMIALWGDKFNTAKLLLEYGANPNIRYKGKTLLMYAAMNYKKDDVELLLEHKALIDLRDECCSGKTVLDYADDFAIRELIGKTRAKRVKDLANIIESFLIPDLAAIIISFIGV